MNRIRFAITLLLLLVSAQLFAQAGTTEVGGALVFTRFDSTEIEDEDGFSATIEFESNLGFEGSVNHFWTDRFSTEFALTSVSADMNVDFGDEPVVLEDLGEIDLFIGSATALWHFGGAGSRVDPYIGGGVAYVSGSFSAEDLEPEDPQEVDLESEIAFVAQAGLSVRVGERVVIGGSVRYIPYEGREEGAPDAEALDLNPLMVSTYVRFRF